MKILVWLFLILMPLESYAQAIDILVENRQVSTQGELSLELLTSTEDAKNYRIRPVVDKGTVEIKNDLGKWVSGLDMWTNFPYLSQKILLKFKPVTLREVAFKLQVQDISSGKIFETGQINLEHIQQKEEYVKNINTSAVNVAGKDMGLTVADSPEETSQTLKAPNNIMNPGFMISIFVTGLLMALMPLWAVVKAPPSD